jgi:hypothetical protein
MGLPEFCWPQNFSKDPSFNSGDEAGVEADREVSVGAPNQQLLSVHHPWIDSHGFGFPCFRRTPRISWGLLVMPTAAATSCVCCHARRGEQLRSRRQAMAGDSRSCPAPAYHLSHTHTRARDVDPRIRKWTDCSNLRKWTNRSNLSYTEMDELLQPFVYGNGQTVPTCRVYTEMDELFPSFIWLYSKILLDGGTRDSFLDNQSKYLTNDCNHP